jgi:hypothetical protein
MGVAASSLKRSNDTAKKLNYKPLRSFCFRGTQLIYEHLIEMEKLQKKKLPSK